MKLNSLLYSDSMKFALWLASESWRWHYKYVSPHAWFRRRHISARHLRTPI